MAGENTGSFALAFDNGEFSGSLDVSAKVFNSAGGRFHQLIQTIPTSEAALNLGGITNVGAFAIRNLDETNYVEVKVGTAGAIFARLEPDANGDGKGGFICGTRLGSGAQVPYLIANTDPVKVAVLLIEL